MTIPPELDVELDVELIKNSPTILRLIEEVRATEAFGIPNAYNRTYNRHNRSGAWFPVPLYPAKPTKPVTPTKPEDK
jgi:hypothetical protein